MTERHKSLTKRREELIARSTIQREQLVAQMATVWQPGALSTGRNILLQARKKPLLSGLMAVLTFLFFRKRRLFSLLVTGIAILKAWSELSPYTQPFMNKLKQFYRERRSRLKP